MVLSDCIKCWDTPCSCGHEGYFIIYKKETDCKSREEILEKLIELEKLKQAFEEK